MVNVVSKRTTLEIEPEDIDDEYANCKFIEAHVTSDGKLRVVLEEQEEG